MMIHVPSHDIANRNEQMPQKKPRMFVSYPYYFLTSAADEGVSVSEVQLLFEQ